MPASDEPRSTRTTTESATTQLCTLPTDGNWHRRYAPEVPIGRPYRPKCEETIYRRYAERYHRPADDINPPGICPPAAKFNRFFAKALEALSNADREAPWQPGRVVPA
jgi:hypothetical protein